MSYVLGSIKDMLQLPDKNQTLIGAEAANFLEVYQNVADSSWRKGLDLRTLMKFGEWIKEPNFALKVSSLRAVRTWSLAFDKTRNLLWIVFADDVWVWDMTNAKLHIIKLPADALQPARRRGEGRFGAISTPSPPAPKGWGTLWVKTGCRRTRGSERRLSGRGR